MSNDHPVPFRFKQRVEDFSHAVDEDVVSALRDARSSIIPSDNVYGYSHGTKWRTQPTEDGDSSGELQLHSFEFAMPFERIVNNDVAAISDYKDEIIQRLMDGFMRMMYETVNAATEKTGNIVSTKGGPFKAEYFIEMLEKIEFGVDRQGNVTLPEIHTGPGVTEKMLTELSAQGPEFQQRVEEIKARKSETALEKEAQRKSKFPKRNGD